jgi:hypothetical protein
MDYIYNSKKNQLKICSTLEETKKTNPSMNSVRSD